MTDKLVQKKEEIDLTTLHISSLAHLCRQATDRYFRHEPYDDSSCLELFRRAIEEKDEAAWTVLIDQYGNLVRAWIQRHPSFARSDEDSDYFVNRAFDTFWTIFNRNPAKLGNFSNLKPLLQYLKLCAHSAVKEYVDRRIHPYHLTRSEQPVEEIAEKVDSIGAVDNRLFASIVWKHILAAVKTEQERLIAVDSLINDIKPQEIYERHPEQFADVAQVRRVKGNFMTRLRRDKHLKAILGDGE